MVEGRIKTFYDENCLLCQKFVKDPDKTIEQIVAEAEKMNAIFFADAGDGNDFETPAMEGENMMGWLVPVERAKEFEPLWAMSAIDDSWTDFYGWAVWSIVGDIVEIHFEM